jgi:hypothetical protein
MCTKNNLFYRNKKLQESTFSTISVEISISNKEVDSTISVVASKSNGIPFS